MKHPYLFSFVPWQSDPPQYILIYAENEGSARTIACDKLYYTSGKKAKEKDVISCTHTG